MWHAFLKFLYLDPEKDYNGGSVEVVFPESAEEGDIACNRIGIIDDKALECTHNFTVAITSATLGTTFSGPQSEATVTIVDNDGEWNRRLSGR